MPPRINEFSQPVGDAVPGWTERPRPPRAPMAGRLVRLEPLNPARHAAKLYEAFSQAPDGRLWTYVPTEPPLSESDMIRWAESYESRDDLVMHTILVRGAPVGYCAFMHLDPANGSIEVGHVLFSPALQRSAAATEAMYLMMRGAFDELGYRRYEWKCDALNAPSLAAAKRLGFKFEGIFRNAMVLKGRNRDTAWLSITNGEWPKVKAALEAWLEAKNFDAEGRQLRRLEDIRTAIPG